MFVRAVDVVYRRTVVPGQRKRSWHGAPSAARQHLEMHGIVELIWLQRATLFAI